MIFLYFYEKSEKFLHTALNCTEIRPCAKTMFPDSEPNAKTDRSLPLLDNTQGLFKKVGCIRVFSDTPNFQLKTILYRVFFQLSADVIAHYLYLVVFTVIIVKRVIHAVLCNEIVRCLGVISAVRSEQHILAPKELALGQIGVLGLDHIERRAADQIVIERPNKVIIADERAASFVHYDGALLHFLERFLVEHVVVILSKVHMDAATVQGGAQNLRRYKQRKIAL